jgi:peptide/nickel transport system substrate-binding protein
MLISKKLGALLTAPLAIVFSLVGVSSSHAAASTLTIGSLSDVKSWDPSQAHLGHMVPMYQAAYDTFFLKDPKGNILPNLVKSWRYDASNLNLQLTLQGGIKFTDGEAWDAAAAVANLDNNRKSNGPDASQIASISSETIDGPLKLTVHLSSVNPALLNYLAGSSGFVGAPKLLGTPAIAAAPVGTGPYIFNASASSKGSKYVFNANPNYWNKANQKFSTVTFLVMLDVTSRLNALISGQVDATLLTVQTAGAAKSAGMTLHENFTDVSNIQLFDRAGAKVKALGDIRVRQALNYAIDRAALLKADQNGIGAVTEQMFGPASGSYVASLDNTYPYDPAKAIALLKAAGYPKLTIPMPDISFVDPNLQAFLTQYYAAVGVTIQWVSGSSANFVSDMKSGKDAASWFQLFQGSPWEEISLIASPNATWNVFGSTDAKVARYLTQIQANPKQVATYGAAINTEIVNQAWFVPLFRLSQQFFTGSHVTVVPQVAQAVPSLFNYSPTGA